MQRDIAASVELEHVLTVLYAEILTFLAKAKKFFETPTAGKHRELKALRVTQTKEHSSHG